MVARAFSVENPEAMTDLLHGLDNIASESVLRQAAVAGARVIFDEVKLRAPVRAAGFEKSGSGREPGLLKRSILVAYDKETSLAGKSASYLVTWSREAFYGRFVEYGTSKMAARPFLRPGYEAKRQAAAEAVSRVIQQKTEEANSGK